MCPIRSIWILQRTSLNGKDRSTGCGRYEKAIRQNNHQTGEAAGQLIEWLSANVEAIRRDVDEEEKEIEKKLGRTLEKGESNPFISSFEEIILY